MTKSLQQRKQAPVIPNDGRAFKEDDMGSILSRDNLENALDHIDWAGTHLFNACDDLQKASMCIPAKSSWWSKIDYLTYDFATIEEELRKIKEEIQEALKRRQ